VNHIVTHRCQDFAYASQQWWQPKQKSLGIKDILYYEIYPSCIAAWSIFLAFFIYCHHFLKSWCLCDYMVHFLKTLCKLAFCPPSMLSAKKCSSTRLVVTNFTYKHKSLNPTVNAHFMLISSLSSSSSTRSWWEPILHFLAFSAATMVLFKHTVTTPKEKVEYEILGPRAQLKQTLITTTLT